MEEKESWPHVICFLLFSTPCVHPLYPTPVSSSFQPLILFCSDCSKTCIVTANGNGTRWLRSERPPVTSFERGAGGRRGGKALGIQGTVSAFSHRLLRGGQLPMGEKGAEISIHG